MAARIADCQFSLLDSANHLVMAQDPNWRLALDSIRRFLGGG